MNSSEARSFPFLAISILAVTLFPAASASIGRDIRKDRIRTVPVSPMVRRMVHREIRRVHRPAVPFRTLRAVAAEAVPAQTVRRVPALPAALGPTRRILRLPFRDKHAN
jgi:hypothetical protein